MCSFHLFCLHYFCQNNHLEFDANEFQRNASFYIPMLVFRRKELVDSIETQKTISQFIIMTLWLFKMWNVSDADCESESDHQFWLCSIDQIQKLYSIEILFVIREKKTTNIILIAPFMFFFFEIFLKMINNRSLRSTHKNNY